MGLRTVIFWLHLICGIAIGLVILIMAVTGTVLAFETQIVEHFEKNVRLVDVAQGAPRLALSEIVAKASAERPDAKIHSVMVKSNPSASVQVTFGRDDSFYFDPYKGIKLGGHSPAHEFMHWVEVWHRWLGMEGKWKSVGHNIKGVCNMAFLVMIVSGLYLWWPKRWVWPAIAGIITFRPQAKGKARDWNWHNVIGFWAAPILIVITLTGTILSYQWANDLLYRMTGNEPPVSQQADKSKEESRGQAIGERKLSEPNHPMVSWDVMVRNVEPLIPGWISMTFKIAGEQQSRAGSGTIVVTVQEPEPRNLNPRAQITLDRVSGEVIKIETFGQQNDGRKLRVWSRYAHTGQAFGIIGQLLFGLASLAAVALVWTGCALAWRRFFAKS